MINKFEFIVIMMVGLLDFFLIDFDIINSFYIYKWIKYEINVI